MTMNRRLFVAALASLAAASALSAARPTPLAAQDLTGVWRISYETPRGTRTMELTLTQDGSALTGSMEMRRGRPGGGQARTRTIEIKDGQVDGADFSFVLEMSFGQRSFRQTFKGTVDGDTMKGTIETPRGSNPFTGKRQKTK